MCVMRIPLSVAVLLASSALCVAQEPAKPPAPGGIVSEDLLDAPETPPQEAAPAGEAAAAQAYADGDLAGAIAAYRELADRTADPREKTRLRVTAAWLVLQQGDAEAARRELAGALYATPEFPIQGDRYSSEFLSLFLDAQRDAAAARSRDASARLQEGVAALSRGDTPRARELLQESLRLLPNQPLAIYNLALVELREGHGDAALAGFEKALTLARSATDRSGRDLQGQALNNIGALYLQREQWEDAAEALERAAALDARDAGVWFNLGLARQKLGRKLDALDALRRAHELDRGNQTTASLLARAYGESGSWVEAVAVLVEATRLRPDDAALVFQLALSERALGNETGAEASLRRALAIDADDRTGVGGQAALLLAERSLAGKNYGQALETATTATRLRPEDASAWAYLALAEQGQGRLAEAAESLRRATELAPDRADLAHNLGTILLAERRYADAELAFRRAVELDPSSAASAQALANLESRSATAPTPAKPPASKASEPARRELGLRLKAVDYAPLGIRGLLVESVAPGSLAAASGMMANDLILRAANRAVADAQALQREAQQAVRSGSLRLSVLRAGKPVEVTLRLQ